MAWYGENSRAKVGVCKDCTEREVGCHSSCERYITAKKEWEAEKNRIYTEKCKDSNYDNYHFNAIYRHKVNKEKKTKKKSRR